MGWESSGVVRFDLGPLLQGQTRIAKPKSAYNSLIIRLEVWNGYKILTANILGLILKNKMAATGISLSVMKSAYISLIIGPRGLGW